MKFTAVIVVILFSSLCYSKVSLTLEQGPAWQSKNEFNIPGSTGSRVDLANSDSGPYYSMRLEGRWQLATNHAVKVLIAPYTSSTSFRSASDFTFQDYTFSGSQTLSTNYKFNSYRVSYLYTFNPKSNLRFTLGATAKIRDANIRVSDGVITKENPNLGFVPLLHLEVELLLDSKFTVALVADALAAPQGRAEDVLIKGIYNLDDKWRLYAGYRTLEGGANNSNVYTFAWLHYAVVGIESDFDWLAGEI